MRPRWTTFSHHYQPSQVYFKSFTSKQPLVHKVVPQRTTKAVKMQFFAIAALFAATAMAAPRNDFSDELCGNRQLYGNPMCCGTDVLGLLDLDCYVRTCCSTPETI